MPNPSSSAFAGRSALRDADFWTGLVLAGAGGVALYQALGFDGASRNFPLIVSGLLTAAGLALLARCLTGKLTNPLKRREMVAIAAAIGLIALWIVALKSGLGFVISTFALQLGLLWLAGERRLLRAALISALIAVAAYLTFAMLLDVRLPRSFLNFILPGL